MKKFTNLPHGAIRTVAAELNVSVSLVSKVANGERRNVRIEEALTKKALDHEARLKRIQRMKAKLDKLLIGETDPTKNA